MSDPIITLPSLPDAPDFLGKAARVEQVSNLLANAQEQALNLRSTMLMNGHTAENKIPTMDGSAAEKTYGQRMTILAQGMAALLAEHQDITEELAEAAIERRRRIAVQIDKQHREETA